MQKLSEDIVLVIIITLFILLVVSFIVIFIILYQKRHQAFIKEKAVLQHEFQQTLLQSQLEIQEQTLHTISQEIHDNIGQVLSLVKLNLGTMSVNNLEVLGRKIHDSKELVGKAIQDLRNLAKGLNTSLINDLGLLRSVEYELDTVSKIGGLITRLEITGIPVKLDGKKELILFRIIQEVINNTIKHAQATELLIQINFDTGVLEITIMDNGKGFDLTLIDINENCKFGLGVRNIQNRAQLIGASLHLSSIPQTGTTVAISLPIAR